MSPWSRRTSGPQRKGGDALTVQWDEAAAENRGTAELMAEYKALAEKPGNAGPQRRRCRQGVWPVRRRPLPQTFEFPYLAHAPMEPLDCVVRLEGDRCEIWAGDQFQTIDQGNAAAAAGLKPASG